MEERPLRSPRLMLQCQSCDEGEVGSIISLEDVILYLSSGVVYSSRANYLSVTQMHRIIDTEIYCLSPLNSEFALLLCTNGVIRMFSKCTGYTLDLFRIDLKESRKQETDPIHDILICACPRVKLLCIANIDVLYILEIDLGSEEEKVHFSVENEVDEVPKLISATKVVIDLDADIESGCIWGDLNLQFIVYRSCTSLFTYEIYTNNKDESKKGLEIKSVVEYQSGHNSYISAL